MTASTPAEFLPLTARVFHILLALAGEARNGYQIMLAVEDNSSARIRIGPGTLYEALHRLREQGLIEESAAGHTKIDGRRQRFYRLSRLGKRVLREEAARLAGDVRVAREQKLIGEAGR